MSDDASLTDFAGGGDDDGGDTDEDDGKNDDLSNTKPAEKPTYTYTSTPDGVACEACGDVVEVRWHAGEGGTAEEPDLPTDALVCPDCKAW